MAATENRILVREIRKWVQACTQSSASDRELLQRFRDRGNEDAFAALLQRHRQCVWGVCWRTLQNEADAEDAFQATFLVLALKADLIRKAESLASWLHGVAYRCALQIKRREARRRVHETKATTMKQTNAHNETAWRELQCVLDEEVQRLAETQRLPFVLCCLEGLSKSEAAQQLGWKEGTVSSRLARARQRIQQRLARRGITLSAVLCAVAVSPSTINGAQAALAESTLRAAVAVANGKTVAKAGISTEVAAVVKGVSKSMSTLKIKMLTLLLPALLLVGAGTGTFALQSTADSASDPAAPAKMAIPQDKTSKTIPVIAVEKKSAVGNQGKVEVLNKFKPIDIEKKQPSESTKKRLKQVQKVLDSIVLEISPFGEQQRRDSQNTLRLLGPKAKALGKQRPGVELRVTRDEMEKMIVALAATGFFDRAQDDPISQFPPKTTYFVQLYGPVTFFEPLHGEPLLDQLLALRKAMTGEAAKAMDRLYVHVQSQEKVVRPIREDEDILHYADRFGLKGLVSEGPNKPYRRPKYGDVALEKAEKELKYISRPWTINKIIEFYREELKKPPVQQAQKPLLQRVMAASRDPRATVLLGEAVEGERPELGAVYAVMDYFLPVVAGGTEQHVEAVQKWWHDNEKRLRAEAKQREEQAKSKQQTPQQLQQPLQNILFPTGDDGKEEAPGKYLMYMDETLMAPAAPGSKGKGLTLEIECDQKYQYLFAEPIWIRCSLTNHSGQPITIPYMPNHYINSIIVNATGPDGKKVEVYHLLREDSWGPQPLTIAPGERLVQWYNLSDSLKLVAAGEYKLQVHFESNGKSIDPKTRQWRTNHWKGKVTSAPFKIQLSEPVNPADKAALKRLMKNSAPQNPYAYSNVMADDKTRQDLLEQHQQSRYANYAQYELGWYDLFVSAQGKVFAQWAVEKLKKVDLENYPALFQEKCEFHLLQAKVRAGAPPQELSETVHRFVTRYPHSPFVHLLNERH